MKQIWTGLALVAALATPALVAAQSLPPSTQDRQAIATLTYQANLPGTSATERAAIARRISELQYQINTRPLIAPMPTIAPNWTGNVAPINQLPALNPNATPVPLGPSIYGSCEAERSVVAYLDEQLSLPSTTYQERQYALSRRAELEKDLRARGC